MSRPPKLERSTGLNLYLPERLRARLDLHLWSKSQGRVPAAAYQKFFTKLLTDFFDKEPRL